MTAVLSCQDYGFSFGEKPVLKKISFSLEKGAYLSIIGPNGAGKSTLLKSFLRLHEAGRASGSMHVHGRSLASYSQRELARLIAYVPQAGGRMPPFTVATFLALSRYPHAVRAGSLRESDRESIARAFELTEVTHLADRRLDTLSGGERQRACLAAALAQDTDILLLDEPASFLDPRHISDVNALLKRLNREHGFTILTVTHDLGHPLDAGGQALVLRQGEQRYFGPAKNLAEEGILEAAFDHTFTYCVHPKTGETIVLPDQA
jgi:ABC-type cobalamin/Fe3+-siderophores transport systems, ATPase components